MIITGSAYGRRATLEVSGHTLTWRAHHGFTPVAENIVTTIHDVRFARLLVLRHSWTGFVIAALGALWLAREGSLLGGIALAVAAGIMIWRFTHPRKFLVLELGQSRLVMRVTVESAEAARVLAERIDQALMSGEVPTSPPMLP